MRGKGKPDPEPRREHRITPAHAGKRSSGTQTGQGGGDHPRACGEKRSCFRCSCSRVGSPPRMRGKVSSPLLYHSQGGITPAHAGKRMLLSATGSPPRDHPRACGEKIAEFFSAARQRGSPPRMRGKEPRIFAMLGRVRITPAHAGKSLSNEGVRKLYKDHPRACGEKFLELLDDVAPLGSPPRMRGKALGPSLPRIICGITPAHAGKRCARQS